MKILLSTRNLSPHRVAKAANLLGFDGLELVMQTKAKRGEWSLDGVKRIGAIHGPSRKPGHSHNGFTSILDDTISLALSLGVSIVNIHPPSAHEDVGGRQHVLDGIEEIRERMDDRPDVTVCYEVLAMPTKPNHFFEQPYKNPRDWLSDVKKYELNATLDTTHLASWGEDPATFVRSLGHRLRHVHVSDYSSKGKEKQHLFPGEGEIDWPPFFEALRSEERYREISITIEPGNRFNILGEDKQRLLKSLHFVRRGLGL